MEKNKNMPFVRIALALALFICSAAIAFILKSRYDMGPSPFDLSVQQWFFSLRGDGLNAIVSALTHCGDTATIIALCIILLLLPNRLKFGVPVSISALGGVAIYKPMKHIFMRARPDEVFHLVEQAAHISHKEALQKSDCQKYSDRLMRRPDDHHRAQQNICGSPLAYRRAVRMAHRLCRPHHRHYNFRKDE